MSRQTYYFDYAAATPLSQTVLQAMQPYLSDNFYNPSALYLAGQQARHAVDDARTAVAASIGAKPSEIIFTAGGTESANLAIRGVMELYPDGNCVVSAIEHEAVLAPAGRYNHKLAPVRPDGVIDVAALGALIDDKTVLISVMLANNEIGTVQPLREIAGIIDTERRRRRESADQTVRSTPLYLHTDACQAANCLPLSVTRYGVDLMTLNGGKTYGPKQSGALFVRTGTRLQPQILGGGQERGLRSGTENVAAIIGFAAALAEATAIRPQESARLATLQKRILNAVKEAFPDAIINGSLKHRLAGNVHVTFPGTDNERLLMELDERGLQVATGSACSASSDEPSHVLRALGLAPAAARSSIRITLGRGSDETAANALLAGLQAAVPLCRF